MRRGQPLLTVFLVTAYWSRFLGNPQTYTFQAQAARPGIWQLITFMETLNDSAAT